MGETREQEPATPFDLTIMALAEVNETATIAALREAGPTRAGDPKLGMFGWLLSDRLLTLVRAADMAHRQLDTDGWGSMSIEERAGWIVASGSWLRIERRPELGRIMRAYRENVTIITSTACAS